jgi:hypothetical protein
MMAAVETERVAAMVLVALAPAAAMMVMVSSKHV